MKKTYSEMMSDVEKGLAAAEIAGPEAVAKMAIGVEDANYGADFTKESAGLVTGIAEEALNDVAGLEDCQIEAAKYGLMLDQDPIGVIGQARSVTVDGPSVAVEAGLFGESDVYGEQVVATEAFDGQMVASNKPYSFGVNLVMAKQDQFMEAIYPTVVLSPGTSGCTVTVTSERIEGQFLRSNPKPDRLKRNSIPLIKALIDADSVLAGEKTRLVPVSNTTNGAVLINAYSYPTDVTGEVITTAPIKVNVDAPIIGISQTAAQLTEGVRNNTDALDDTVVLEELFYKLDDGNNTSVHKFNVSGFGAAKWVPSAAGHSKDVVLNFISDAITIDTTNTKQLDGSDSQVLTDLNIPDHKIQIRAVIYGNGNTQIGDISVSPAKLELVSIKDATGGLVAETSATYQAVKDVIDAMVIEGYTVEAYMTNSNLRSIGYILSTETLTTVYSVGYRTPISVLKPKVHTADTDNDANKIKSFGNQSRAMSSVIGINKLLKYAGFLRNAVANGADLTLSEMAGAAKDLVNPYYSDKVIDLALHVDSLNSKDLKENVKAALVNTISNTVNEMMDATGYLDAFENTQVAPGQKPTIVIATDRKIKSILTGGSEGVNLGENVNVKIVSTGSKAFAGRMMVLPTTGQAGVNILNFGLRAFIPTPTIEIRRTIDGADVNALYNQPCFEFINLLPILGDFEVTGFETVTRKIPQANI